MYHDNNNMMNVYSTPERSIQGCRVGDLAKLDVWEKIFSDRVDRDQQVWFSSKTT